MTSTTAIDVSKWTLMRVDAVRLRMRRAVPARIVSRGEVLDAAITECLNLMESGR